MADQNITSRTVNDDTIILNPGTLLDNNNAHEMAAAISDAQTRNYRFIIVDMQHLEFISSAGVGSILGSVEAAREIEGDIIICNASETILHVFEVLDLFDYLTIKKTEKEAVKACKLGV